MPTAQSLTITPTNGLLNWADNPLAKQGRINLSWVAATAGTVSYDLAATYAAADASKAHASKVTRIRGHVERIVVNPGSSTAPTDEYNIYFNDKDGVDVFGGNLTSRSSTVTQSVTFNPPVWLDGEYTLSIDSAGDGGVGEIEIYIGS